MFPQKDWKGQRQKTLSLPDQSQMSKSCLSESPLEQEIDNVIVARRYSAWSKCRQTVLSVYGRQTIMRALSHSHSSRKVIKGRYPPRSVRVDTASNKFIMVFQSYLVQHLRSAKPKPVRLKVASCIHDITAKALHMDFSPVLPF
jgi:hypothetical protein